MSRPLVNADVQRAADYLFEETTKLDALISYTACLVLAKNILISTRPSLIQIIEAEARRYADMYPQSSDGRNTFVIFADWVSSRAIDGIGCGKSVIEPWSTPEQDK
jgi:hypothetical protein